MRHWDSTQWAIAIASRRLMLTLVRTCTPVRIIVNRCSCSGLPVGLSAVYKYRNFHPFKHLTACGIAAEQNCQKFRVWNSHGHDHVTTRRGYSRPGNVGGSVNFTVCGGRTIHLIVTAAKLCILQQKYLKKWKWSAVRTRRYNLQPPIPIQNATMHSVTDRQTDRQTHYNIMPRTD